MTPPRIQSPTSRLLRISLWLAVGLGMMVVALGLWGVWQDAAVRGEDWDGMGLFVGKLLITGGVLWSVPHVGLALWALRAKRHGQRLAPIGTASAALAGALLIPLVLSAAAGTNLLILSVPICLLGLVFLSGVLVALEHSP